MSQVVLGFTTKNSFVVYLKSSGTGCPAFLFAEPGAFDPGCGGSSRVGRLCAFSQKGWRPLKGAKRRQPRKGTGDAENSFVDLVPVMKNEDLIHRPLHLFSVLGCILLGA